MGFEGNGSARAANRQFQQRAGPYCRQITRHIQRTIGPATMVFHELLPNGLQLDLHVVPPQRDEPSIEHPFGRNFFTVVTSGMSTQRMPPRQARGKAQYLELMISLPPNWAGLNSNGTFDAAAGSIKLDDLDDLAPSTPKE